MTKFRNTYRIESARLKGWDYTRGWYFITICTHRRKPHFGAIDNGVVHLSRAGEIVQEEWLRTPVIRPTTQIDAWVIMPDHFHAIIGLHRQDGIGSYQDAVPPAWTSGSLGAIVCQFKSICTKRIRSEGFSDFAWQSRYYDCRISTSRALQNIRQYIIANPLKKNRAQQHNSRSSTQRHDSTSAPEE